MFIFVLFVLGSLAGVASAVAAPGTTTTSVNLRSGPGAQFEPVRTLPAGAAVEIGKCCRRIPTRHGQERAAE